MRAFDVSLRAPFDAATVRAAAARALGVEADAFADGPSPSESGLWLDVFASTGAFRVLAKFQVDDEQVNAPEMVDVARALASDLGTDAVVPADDEADGIPFGPYTWLLVRPSGEILGANEDAEADDADDDGLVLDERPEQLHLLRAATR